MVNTLQQNSLAGIWTPDISRKFYEDVNALSRKLKPKQSPRAPKNYRGGAPRAKETKRYILPYEEELHLADHIAFLAHVVEGVEYVSAAVLQEMSDPPSFTFRLASNHTPRPHVVDGIERILGIVQNHAQAGMLVDQFRFIHSPNSLFTQGDTGNTINRNFSMKSYPSARSEFTAA
jgi:hypothetical protein